MFGCPYIIILVELCERVYETWNICLVRKRQRNGAYQSGAYRSYARKTAYPAFQKSAICGLFPKTQKSPLTGGEKKIANRPKNATSYHKETKIGFIVKTQRKIENI